MSETIRFDDIKITDSGFSCNVKSSLREKSDELTFELCAPEGEKLQAPSTDAIAYTLSTLCGTTYGTIHMDLEITEECREKLKAFTKAEVIVPACIQKVEQETAEKNAVVLNFSGGFDSLAAMSLMPKDTRLVAVDFGGWFERETDFFEKFSPYVLRTNFRKLKYDRESWTFMGAGSLLFSESLNAKYNIFGTILEASANQMTENPVNAIRQETMPFSGLGLQDMRVVNGLTEVGTAMICTYYFTVRN